MPTKIKPKENNYAFIDGQNLYMGTSKREQKPWHINLAKFRIYLQDKYQVTKAFYFLGYVNEENENLYEQIQSAGYILVFREHNQAMLGQKKGNVDSDIIFQIMKRIYKREAFSKVVLVSGDGDYRMLVDFLIEEKKFKKILFPDSDKSSSLYKKIGSQFFDYLDSRDVRKKIQYMKKAP